MGLLPEGEANLARLLGIVEKSQVSMVMVILVVVFMLLVVIGDVGYGGGVWVLSKRVR